MPDSPTSWNYPKDLPVVAHRLEIIRAIQDHQVIVVVSDTGSGKTTQLPKMVAETIGTTHGRIACTQPRRIAAASVSKRVAEELSTPLGDFVGYHVRFDSCSSADTAILFMTDGILLAETQGNPQLKSYSAIIIDEAHERSLNIDFLLGYLKQLLPKRPDLKVIISSATLDAASFSSFFASEQTPCPIIHAPGRLFPVAEFFLPPNEDEELPQHVARGYEFLESVDPSGDTLIFLPGEREIRDCTDTLSGKNFPNTLVLPLFARLSLADQQRVFNPGPQRRIILATNVAETSLTIPRIARVIDSGLARVNRWSPAKGVQRLQIEPISRASSGQRKGRCGRVRDGSCLRLYSEPELLDRPEFSDPEIRRSSLAGVILRMKALKLPNIEDFPFIDPPSPKAIAEGYRTLREVGALDAQKNLTPLGQRIAQLPVDPRLGRMILAAESEKCLPDVLPIIAALESNDPRDRPSEKAREADLAHQRWKHAESDFISLLLLWQEVSSFQISSGKWRGNALRKFCSQHFLSARRVVEWGNIIDELKDILQRAHTKSNRNARSSRQTNPPLARPSPASAIPYAAIHRSLLAGCPRQFGLWDRESKSYRSAAGGFFAVFPGSSLFNQPKRYEWVFAMEIVETSRIWARRIAKIDPTWLESVAPHLCHSRYSNAHWDKAQGAVYGYETVTIGGLPIISNRKIHYGRIDPATAHAVFLRDGLLANALANRNPLSDYLSEIHEQISAVEHKLRRIGGLWCDEAILRYLHEQIPVSIHTAKAFYQWLPPHIETLTAGIANVLNEDLDALGLEGFPDTLYHHHQEFPLYYHCHPGAPDDGVTVGIHLDQIPQFPEWLPDWGVDGNLADRAESLLRSLPKDFRKSCQPIRALAEAFADRWVHVEKTAPIQHELSVFIREYSGAFVPADSFCPADLPPHLITKIWICNDEGEEVALGCHFPTLKQQLAPTLNARFEAAANAQIECSGMTSWPNDLSIPSELSTPGGPAYPALLDESTSVGVRAFPNPHESNLSHRAGIARLLILANPLEVSYLKKKFPLGLMAKVELPRLSPGGTSVDDLIRLTAASLAHPNYPRNPHDFSNLCQKSKGSWFQHASAIGKAIDDTFDLLPDIQTFILANLRDRNLGPIAADIQNQLSWLFQRDFSWLAGPSSLLLYPRTLKAIHARILRLKSFPIAKDLEKMQRLHQLWTPWFNAWSATPHSASLNHFAWALEDFRTSLFAPDIPLANKISEKRLSDSWTSLNSTPNLST